MYYIMLRTYYYNIDYDIALYNTRAVRSRYLSFAISAYVHGFRLFNDVRTRVFHEQGSASTNDDIVLLKSDRIKIHNFGILLRTHIY